MNSSPPISFSPFGIAVARNRTAQGSALALAMFASVHCGSSSTAPDCTSTADCPPGTADGGSGIETGSEAGAIPSTCDLEKSVKDSPTCVDDSVGIFVAPAGDDFSEGTRAKPVRTIMKALELASASSRPRVYVCEGTFDERVSIARPISINGGLSCSWQVKASARPRLAPMTGVPLTIARANGVVVIEDLEIVGGADPAASGASAVAVFVSESKSVTFRRTTIVAGAGVAGAKGATASNYSGAIAAKGKNALAGAGGPEQTCACADGVSSSKGGRGGTAVGPSPSPGAATPAVGGINSGGSSYESCIVGSAGADGTAGTKGAGASTPGTVTSAGWGAGPRGASGGNGNPGQGGGGGGCIELVTAGGAGGGCGGCGGRGGEGGLAGGSSFALVSFESAVSVIDCSLTSGAAGKGGEGGDGQDGQVGGESGLGACVGGSGGFGAGGSGGGGGAGGHSIVVYYRGPQPRLEGTTLTPGPHGSAGAGGVGGASGGNAGVNGDQGSDGVAAATVAAQ